MVDVVTAGNGVVARIALDQILPGIAFDVIVFAAAANRIVIIATKDLVVALLAEDVVPAVVAMQDIARRIVVVAEDAVAVDRILSVIAVDCVGAARTMKSRTRWIESEVPTMG